jgi:hypothetical protein
MAPPTMAPPINPAATPAATLPSPALAGAAGISDAPIVATASSAAIVLFICWISWNWRSRCGLAGFRAETGIGLASVWFAHDLSGKPVSTPHQVRGRLFPGHALENAKTVNPG